MDHASSYMYETIRPQRILEALNYMFQQPLYKDAEFNSQFFDRYKDQSEVPLIVDKNDDDEQISMII